ncbi:vomeronasal type-2 receptor 26-like [Echinops telfairi]|uniref:Vomeronasal type-2 receptor 26-like n=1 Tax=Echinops telfairi TaxID=9371 RepID=A0AC59C794_ECHTE|nr:vomeronasal type-2 receptor 26-like [Echinops telfairi]
MMSVHPMPPKLLFPRLLWTWTRMKSIEYLYNTVYLVAQALHEMILMRGEETRSRRDARFPVWLLHHFLKHTQLENISGERVSLDENRHEKSQYEILNYSELPEGFELHVKVGELVSQDLHGQSLTIREKLIEWPIGSNRLHEFFKYIQKKRLDMRIIVYPRNLLPNLYLLAYN